MRMRFLLSVCVALACGLTDVHGTRQVTSGKPLPALKRQAMPKAVVDEHLDALNRCDWTRLMAQYPPDVEIFLPGGQVVRGRRAVGDLFEGFVKPFKDGGLCGLKFESEHVSIVGDTVNVQWRANADFLAAPYLGADAYVTQDGLMRAQVSTFDGAQLKKRATAAAAPAQEKPQAPAPAQGRGNTPIVLAPDDVRAFPDAPAGFNTRRGHVTVGSSPQVRAGSR